MTQASQDRSLSWTKLSWILLIVICTISRMVLVADDEIYPIKFDSTNYAKMASHYVDIDAALRIIGIGDPNQKLAHDPFKSFPTHRPGLGLLAWGSSQIGVPYKLFLDGLILLGSVLAGLSIGRITKTPLVGMIAFILLMFNPWALQHSQLFMTEPMIAVVILLSLIHI